MELSKITSSVLLLTYNQEKYVAQSLQSLLDQDLDALEIIVSDDHSCDSTWSVIKKIASEYLGAKSLILIVTAKI